MNPRDRLRAVLTGQMPDRVPISTYELVGYNSLAFENNDPSYRRLMDAIRAQTDCICMWNPPSNATFLATANPVEIEVETRREDDSTTTHRTLHTPQGDLTQTTRVFDHVHTVWQTEHWCKSPADIDRALCVPYESPRYDVIGAAEEHNRIRNEVGAQGILMSSLPDPLCLAAELMAFGEYTVWAMTETAHFGRTIAILHEQNMENLRRLLAACPVDLYRICGPEYATPPFLPPRFFDQFVVPYVREMTDLIHSYGALVRLHCHGRIRQVLDMITATGADGLDPCEGPPDGDIHLAEIKQRIGDRLCLFGNLQLKLLEHGSPDQVQAAVQECMSAAKAGGRYVIMPTAAPINSPLALKTEENYIRFIETAQAFGQY